MHNAVGFNSSQSKAILFGAGPMLVIAGPGSGKTLVITHRIKNLIFEKKVKPENILVVTFTKAAAIEMQYRFCALTSDYNRSLPVNFGTCHAIFFQIIREATSLNAGSILKESEKREILEEILASQEKKENFILEPSLETIQRLLSDFSKIKNTGVSPEEYEISYCENEEFSFLFYAYKKECFRRQRLDFDDMQSECLELLKSNKKLLEKYQKAFSYILVDEFQDINPVQYEIIKLLSATDNNIFVVGDDDQSIYGFRGANPMIMAHFSDYYNCTKIMLSCNYRSVKSVINVSNSLINCNANRFGKEIYTTNERGNNVVTIGCDGVEEEAAAILERVTSFLNNSKDGKMAILYRTNNKAGYIALLLKLNNIDYIMREKAQNPFDSIVFQDFIHYIRLSENPDSYKINDLIPVINKPLRYINTNIINGSEITYIQLVNLYSNKQYLKDILRKFKYNLLMLSKMDLFSSFRYFTKVIGYEDYINSKYDNDDSKRSEMLEICNELEIRLKMFHSINELYDYIENEKNDNFKENVNRESARIQIMTYHASKGLEFDSVIIPDLNEGSVPNKRASSQEAIEEERRMLYVAFTRAKNNLILLYLNKSKGNDVMKSRFLIPILNLEEYVDCIIKK